MLNFLFSCAKTFVLSSYNGSLGNLPDDCFLEAAGIIQPVKIFVLLDLFLMKITRADCSDKLAND